MIKHYIIDGNNLLGKLKKYNEFRKVKNNDTRGNLALILDRYFINKRFSVTLHFDGHRKDIVKTNKVKLEYSENRSADEWIKHEIMVIKNPKTICVVTSDNNVAQFAKVSSCKVVKSESFAAEIMKKENTDDENSRIKSIKDDEMKKLFGVE
jgi:predicted RNA-binding protein with PIN domain